MKILFLIVIIVFGASMHGVQGQDKFQDGTYDVLVSMDGAVLRIRDRAQIRLSMPVALNDGTLINPDGYYQTKDRQKFQLRNGECLDNNGIKYPNEYQYRYQIEQENKGLAEETVTKRNQHRFHILLLKGHVFQIIHGEQHKIKNPVDLGYGRIVHPDGTYRTSYGFIRLKEGGCINMIGKPLINLYEHRKAVVRKEAKALKKLLKGDEIDSSPDISLTF